MKLPGITMKLLGITMNYNALLGIAMELLRIIRNYYEIILELLGNYWELLGTTRN